MARRPNPDGITPTLWAAHAVADADERALTAGFDLYRRVRDADADADERSSGRRRRLGQARKPRAVGTPPDRQHALAAT